MTDTIVSPAEEQIVDLSGVSLVEEVTTNWIIKAMERKTSSSENGTGVFYALTFEPVDEQVFGHPITMRFFTEYTSAHGKSTDWVNRQAGNLKRIALALNGEPRYSLDPTSPLYLVGKTVSAQTFENNEGRAELRRFKAAR